MKSYKIDFNGVAFILAKDEEEARKNFFEAFYENDDTFDWAEITDVNIDEDYGEDED